MLALKMCSDFKGLLVSQSYNPIELIKVQS